MRFPLHRPVLGPEESEAVAAVLATGHLVQGAQVARFEAELAGTVGVAHGVACSSGTAALHLLVRALGCGPGDEVVVPAFGYPAAANVVEVSGARAVGADVDPDTFAVTGASVRAAASARTVGLIVVHSFGIPAPMVELSALAGERGWWVVEDAACALGTEPRGRWGTLGHASAVSFHPRKSVTTAEGGAVLCDDPEVARRVRALANQGVDGSRSGWERFTEAGLNYRMSDVHAAIGVVQLGRLEAIVSRRREVAGWYREALVDAAWARWPRGYDQPALSCQSVVVEVADGVDRDVLIGRAAELGVQTTLGGYAFGSQPYYRRAHPREPERTPVSVRLFERSLTLPVTHAMTREDVETVVGLLGEAAA